MVTRTLRFYRDVLWHAIRDTFAYANRQGIAVGALIAIVGGYLDATPGFTLSDLFVSTVKASVIVLAGWFVLQLILSPVRIHKERGDKLTKSEKRVQELVTELDAKARVGPELAVFAQWGATHTIPASYELYPSGGDLIEHEFRITNRSDRTVSVTVALWAMTADEGEQFIRPLSLRHRVAAQHGWREWPVDIEPGRTATGIWAYYWSLILDPDGQIVPMLGHRAEITELNCGKTADIDVNGTTRDLEWR